MQRGCGYRYKTKEEPTVTAVHRLEQDQLTSIHHFFSISIQLPHMCETKWMVPACINFKMFLTVWFWKDLFTCFIFPFCGSHVLPFQGPLWSSCTLHSARYHRSPPCRSAGRTFLGDGYTSITTEAWKWGLSFSMFKNDPIHTYQVFKNVFIHMTIENTRLSAVKWVPGQQVAI